MSALHTAHQTQTDALSQLQQAHADASAQLAELTHVNAELRTSKDLAETSLQERTGLLEKQLEVAKEEAQVLLKIADKKSTKLVCACART
jgi:predicted nuclease of restriction endonuclease-like (RecB) superfamily